MRASSVAQRFDLLFVFVAAVEIAALRADDQAADDHSLKDQVGKMLQDEAVFDRAGLALIGVADDELLRARRIARAFPFAIGGEPCPAHAAEFAVLQCIQHPVIHRGSRRTCARRRSGWPHRGRDRP